MKKGIIIAILFCSIIMCSKVKAETYSPIPLGLNVYDNGGNSQLQYLTAYDLFTKNNPGKIYYFAFQPGALTSNSSGIQVPSGANKINIRGMVTIDFAGSGAILDIDCQSYDTNGNCIGWSTKNFNIQITQGNANGGMTCTLNSLSSGVGNGNVIYFTASCPLANNAKYVNYVRFKVETDYDTMYNPTRIYGVNPEAFVIDGNTQIINNQNNNTQQIIESNTTYNNTPSQDYGNQTQEMENITNAEDTLLNNLDLNTTNMDITINPNASTFIWNIVDALRLMSTKIVLLMSSILSLGIIKLILNR